MKAISSYHQTAKEELTSNLWAYVLTIGFYLGVSIVAALLLAIPTVLLLGDSSLATTVTENVLTLLNAICIAFPLAYALSCACLDCLRQPEISPLRRMVDVFFSEWKRGVLAKLLVFVLTMCITVGFILVACIVAVGLMHGSYALTFGLAILICLVPIVIWALMASQTVYIVHDHPEMGVWACIKESIRLMQGRKTHLFALYASLIIWYLLFLVLYVGMFLCFIRGHYIVGGLLVLPIMTGVVLLVPYLQLLLAAFYQDVIADSTVVEVEVED